MFLLLDRLNTLINKITVRSLTLLIFAIGWAVCGQPQPRHESMMPVLSFSLLSAKTFSVQGNVLRKQVASYVLFICQYWYSLVNPVAVMAVKRLFVMLTKNI